MQDVAQANRNKKLMGAAALAYRRDGGPTGIALKRRLEAGRPLPEDEQLIAWAKDIREKRARGMTWRTIGLAMELDERKVRDFASRGKFRVICHWLDQVEAGEKPAEAAKEKTSHRGVLARLVPKALRRLELALNAGEETDERGVVVLRESKTADHAMDTVLEAAGLLEPEGGAVRPVIRIDTLVINGMANQIRLDDQRTAREIEVAVEAAVDA